MKNFFNFYTIAECSEKDYKFLQSVFKYVAVGDVGLGDVLVGFSNVPKYRRKFIKFIETEKAKDLDLRKMQTQYLFNVTDAELPEIIKNFRLTLMGKYVNEEQIIGFCNSLEPDFARVLAGLTPLPENIWVVDNQTGKRL